MVKVNFNFSSEGNLFVKMIANFFPKENMADVTNLYCSKHLKAFKKEFIIQVKLIEINKITLILSD